MGLNPKKCLYPLKPPKKCADPQKALRDGRKCIQPGVCQKKVLQWNLQVCFQCVGFCSKLSHTFSCGKNKCCRKTGELMGNPVFCAVFHWIVSKRQLGAKKLNAGFSVLCYDCYDILSLCIRDILITSEDTKGCHGWSMEPCAPKDKCK